MNKQEEKTANRLNGGDADSGKEASHAKKTDAVYMLDNLLWSKAVNWFASPTLICSNAVLLQLPMPLWSHLHHAVEQS